MSSLHDAIIALCHHCIMSSLNYVIIALYAIIALCHHCTMPSLHYVIIALCHHCTMASLHYVIIALFHHCIMPSLHYVIIALCRHCLMSSTFDPFMFYFKVFLCFGPSPAWNPRPSQRLTHHPGADSCFALIPNYETCFVTSLCIYCVLHLRQYTCFRNVAMIISSAAYTVVDTHQLLNCHRLWTLHFLEILSWNCKNLEFKNSSRFSPIVKCDGV